MLILWLYISSNFNPIVSEHLGLNLRWLRVIKPTGWDYHLMEPVARTAGDHRGQKDSSSTMVTCNKFSGGHPTLFLPCFLLSFRKVRTPSDCIITIITAGEKRGKWEPRGSSAWKPGWYKEHKPYRGIESPPTNSSRAAAPTSRIIRCGVRGNLLGWPWQPTCSTVSATAGGELKTGPSSWAEETLDMLSRPQRAWWLW